jgi:hypothetical protein
MSPTRDLHKVLVLIQATAQREKDTPDGKLLGPLFLFAWVTTDE